MRILRILRIFISFVYLISTNTIALATNSEQPIVCIDAGHQLHGESKKEANSPFTKVKKARVTSGATGIKSRVPEYQMTLALAKRIQSLLRQQKINVIMTRDKHAVKISNKERALLCNHAHADAVIRIHADDSTNQNIHGIRLLYPSPKAIHNKNLAKSSQNLAQDVLDQTIKMTDAISLGVSTRSDLTGFNWSKVPVALIETGFLSNAEEDLLLNDPTYQTKLAKGIVNGLTAFLQRPKDVQAK